MAACIWFVLSKCCCSSCLVMILFLILRLSELVYWVLLIFQFSVGYWFISLYLICYFQTLQWGCFCGDELVRPLCVHTMRFQFKVVLCLLLLTLLSVTITFWLKCDVNRRDNNFYRWVCLMKFSDYKDVCRSSIAGPITVLNMRFGSDSAGHSKSPKKILFKVFMPTI